MLMSIFKGVATAIATPFSADGKINYKVFDQLIEFQIENGVDAIVVAGTSGEASTLTHGEHLHLIRHCVQIVDGRIPVIAGTGSNSTETAVMLSLEAQKAGVDGVLVVSPYYNKATQKGLYEHFKIIAESIQIPVLLYNVPGRTGCNIQPETVVRLCHDVKNIVGIKEASGNISQIAKLISLAEGKIDVYSGNDDQIVPILSLGGSGVISVLSNIAPRQTRDICRFYFNGKTAESAKLQIKSIELINALFCEVNPIPVRSGLDFMGYEMGKPRMPLTEMEEENQKLLKQAMKNYGIL